MKDHIEPAGKRFFLELRSRLIHAVRSFFHDQGFLEIQTPLLTTAPAPEPHIEAIAAAQGRFLTTSPELYMKRLLAAGYERIFQITPVFRAAERGRYHHPEFSLLSGIAQTRITGTFRRTAPIFSGRFTAGPLTPPHGGGETPGSKSTETGSVTRCAKPF